MQEFAEELERALAAASSRDTRAPGDVALVVDVHRLVGSGQCSEKARRALLVTVGEGPSRRPLVVDHWRGEGSRAARALLDALPRSEPAVH
jgi:hypothetical protein